MSTFILIASLILVTGLATITFVAAAMRNSPPLSVDELPDTSPVQPWTETQIKNYRINVGLRRLYDEVAAVDPGDERPEDAYSKKLRLNAEHEAELADRKQARSVYNKAWYAINKEPRKAQVNARAQAIRKAAKRDEVNQARRVAQLAYWTPERKAERSRLTTARMAIKYPKPAIIAPAPVLTYNAADSTYTYGQRALA